MIYENVREIQNQRNTDFKKLSHIPLGNVINRIDTGALPLSSTPSAIIFSVIAPLVRVWQKLKFDLIPEHWHGTPH